MPTPPPTTKLVAEPTPYEFIDFARLSLAEFTTSTAGGAGFVVPIRWLLARIGIWPVPAPEMVFDLGSPRNVIPRDRIPAAAGVALAAHGDALESSGFTYLLTSTDNTTLSPSMSHNVGIYYQRGAFLATLNAFCWDGRWEVRRAISAITEGAEVLCVRDFSPAAAMAARILAPAAATDQLVLELERITRGHALLRPSDPLELVGAMDDAARRHWAVLRSRGVLRPAPPAMIGRCRVGR